MLVPFMSVYISLFALNVLIAAYNFLEKPSIYFYEQAKKFYLKIQNSKVGFKKASTKYEQKESYQDQSE